MQKKLQNSSLFKQACLIGSGWVDSKNKKYIQVKNPANQEIIGHVPDLGTIECEDAIAYAAKAQVEWENLNVWKRCEILQRWFDLIKQNQEDLALILTSEQGKPLLESRGEIEYAASFIKWFAEEAKRSDGDILKSQKDGQEWHVVNEAVGVCAAITPWNFPAAMITRKVGPALAAGCSMILKPADQTPFTALALGALAIEAGIPYGVFQIITGDAKVIGQCLTSSTLVRKLSFTGSTNTGRILMSQCSPSIKKLSLELGGNAPLIIFNDANLAKAVDGVIASKFRNMGQTCVCANRIYVQSGIYDEIVQRVHEKVKNFVVGNGVEPNVTHGPLIDGSAVAKVQAHVKDALQKGAKLVCGGQPAAQGGNFYQPTLLIDATEHMLISQEETFGPVAAFFRFESEEDVIQQANKTDFGLAAYFFTEDYKRIKRLSSKIEAGMIGINTGAISNEVAPFGGVKQSGLGREGSKHGIKEYQEQKYLCIDFN